MEQTSIRDLPDGTKRKYRDLAAQLTIESGKEISMNSLYVKAIVAYVAPVKRITPGK